MIKNFDQLNDFVVLRFNNEMLAMEFEDFFSHCCMGIACISVEPSDSKKHEFICEFDEGDRSSFNTFCKRIGKNYNLENSFKLTREDLIGLIHSFICGQKSKAGYFSSATVSDIECFISLSYSEKVYSKIQALAGVELSKLIKPNVNNGVLSILDLKQNSEKNEINWQLVKKIRNLNQEEECSRDYFLSTVKDYLYEFYDLPSEIALYLTGNKLVCEFSNKDNVKEQLYFVDNELEQLVGKAFFEQSRILKRFECYPDSDLCKLYYQAHC